MAIAPEEAAKVTLEVLLKKGRKDLALLLEEKKHARLGMIVALSSTFFSLLFLVAALLLEAYFPQYISGPWPYLAVVFTASLFLLFFFLYFFQYQKTKEKIKEREALNDAMEKTLKEAEAEAII